MRKKQAAGMYKVSEVTFRARLITALAAEAKKAADGAKK